MSIRVVAGLGNPGQEYDGTRHNVGFEIVDRFVSRFAPRFGGASWKSAHGALITECRTPNGSLWLVKPQSYMNRSGDPIASFLNY